MENISPLEAIAAGLLSAVFICFVLWCIVSMLHG